MNDTSEVCKTAEIRLSTRVSAGVLSLFISFLKNYENAKKKPLSKMSRVIFM